jgi:hypothetical protein
MRLSGKVSSGKFAGETLQSEFNINATVGGCMKSGLTKVSIRQAHPLTIR